MLNNIKNLIGKLNPQPNEPTETSTPPAAPKLVEGGSAAPPLYPQPSTSPPSFEPGTLNLEPSRRRPNGKVARLPRAARDLVNSMLDDGHPYEDIVAKLTELGHPGFSTQNISRWKLGGYEQHLLRQDRADDLHLRTESLMDLVHHFNTASEHSRTPNHASERSPLIHSSTNPSIQSSLTSPSLPPSPQGRGTEGEGDRTLQTFPDLPDHSRTATNTSAHSNSASPPIHSSINPPIQSSPLWSALESFLGLQLFESLLELSHSALPIEQKSKLLYQLGRLVTATTRERTRRDSQSLDTRKYDDERTDLFTPPPPRKKRNLEEPLTQEERMAIVRKVDELLGIKIKVRPPTTDPSSEASDPDSSIYDPWATEPPAPPPSPSVSVPESPCPSVPASSEIPPSVPSVPSFPSESADSAPRTPHSTLQSSTPPASSLSSSAPIRAISGQTHPPSAFSLQPSAFSLAQSQPDRLLAPTSRHHRHHQLPRHHRRLGRPSRNPSRPILEPPRPRRQQR